MPNRLADSPEELLDRYLSGEQTLRGNGHTRCRILRASPGTRAYRVVFAPLASPLISGKIPPDLASTWAVMRTRIEQDLREVRWRPDMVDWQGEQTKSNAWYTGGVISGTLTCILYGE